MHFSVHFPGHRFSHRNQADGGDDMISPAAELRLVVARGFAARLRGLHAFQAFTGGVGLWLVPCRAIHSVRMRYDIDVVFLDKKLRVVRVVENLRPNRLAWCRGAASVVELPAGYCATTPGYETALARALADATGT
ncbi:MAG: DUF192 domain-containing protein, partial [Candidimonas sp.]